MEILSILHGQIVELLKHTNSFIFKTRKRKIAKKPMLQECLKVPLYESVKFYFGTKLQKGNYQEGTPVKYLPWEEKATFLDNFLDKIKFSQNKLVKVANSRKTSLLCLLQCLIW